MVTISNGGNVISQFADPINGTATLLRGAARSLSPQPPLARICRGIFE
jgi:hypothetical protein